MPKWPRQRRSAADDDNVDDNDDGRASEPGWQEQVSMSLEATGGPTGNLQSC